VFARLVSSVADTALAEPLVNALVRVVEGMWRARRPADPRPVDALADLLAKAVEAQWRQEAAERMLLTPEPIPVDWSLSELAVTGPVQAAVGSAEMAPAFPPLPGQSRVTEEQLRAGGRRRELFAVYAGIASGRVVAVGAPGAGKTGSAVLLVLDALEHRKGVEDTQRAGVPVPVLVTAYGWDPLTCPVRDWLVDRLVASYPQLFAHRGGRAEADALVTAGAIALVLDGLDEMDLARRPAALRALSSVPFRVVVLTRSSEMIQAAGVAWLVGAVGLQLHGITGHEGADYLHRACIGPPPLGWTQLLTHLRENSDSILTRGLSTPLGLTLIRDTYRPDNDVTDLLDSNRWSTAEDLERYLITRVLPAAYTPRPGQPALPYRQTQAEQVLVFLARQMNQDHTRDLAWWHIPRWVPTRPRILASMLAAGLLGAILGGLVFGVVWTVLHGVGPVLGDKLLEGLAYGLGLGLPLGIGFGRGGREPKRARTWRAISWRLVLTAGLVYGFVGVLANLLAVGLVFVLSADLTAIPQRLVHPVVNLVSGFTLTFALSDWRGEARGSIQDLANGRGKIWVVGLVVGLVLVLLIGLAVGVVVVRLYHLGLALVLVMGLVAGLVFALVAWLMPRLAGGLVAGLAVEFADGEPSPQGPQESWRHDRVFGLRLGFGLGLGVGFVLGLAKFLTEGPASGLGNLLVTGVSVGLVYGITSSVTWPTTLSWRQLRRFDRVPAVALMPFLEDARARHVLRTVGAVYQFRHATLQDKLADQTTVSAPTSSATQIRA
jgi:hypothetical protein